MSTQFAVVVSDFNREITGKLLSGAIDRLKERGIPDTHISVVHVPGAVEIPLTAQMLAKTNKYAAIICLGAIIRGDTSHYDYVCQQVSFGCQQVMLQHDLPVIFGILTTDNEQQAEERVGGTHGHKGVDAADTAIIMVETMKQFFRL